jgi:integrase
VNGAALKAMTTGQQIDWLKDNRRLLQQQIASLRETARPICERECSDSTIDSYCDDFKRVEAAGSVLAASGSKASFYKLRAASARVLADKIDEALRKAERIRKKENTFTSWAACVLDELLPLGVAFNQFTSEKWTPGAAAPQPLQRSHKQRSKIGRLPKDWRERLWRHNSRGKYADAVAVAALAGVRPAELEKGVTVKLMNDGRLAFVVEGAKVKAAGPGRAAQGQKVRAFQKAIPAGDPMGEHLKTRLAASSNGKIRVRVRTARQLTSAFCAASRRAFPKMDAPPSLYAFRHVFCSDAKSSGATPEQVAQLMGHASVESQQHYGMKRPGKSGNVDPIDPIGSAPTPIRPAKPKPPPPSTQPAPTARREGRAIAAVLPTATARPRAPRPRI